MQHHNHPLNNFKIQKCYQNEPKFNGINSRYNLPKIKDGKYIKDGAHMINLDEYKSIATYYIVSYVYVKYVTTWIILESNTPQRNYKIYRKQRYHNKKKKKTSKWFNNMCILFEFVR